MNIVCWPVLVEVEFREQNKSRVYLPFLAVSTEFDYAFYSTASINTLKQQLIDDIWTYFGSSDMFNFLEPYDVFVVDDPSLKQVIATYYSDSKVQTAYYKQQSNYVEFHHDFSSGKMREFYGGTPT